MKTRLLILALLLSGCTAQGLEEAQERLVVEGWISSGEQPVVMVTTSVTLSSEFQSVSDQADHVIRWAKVSISDGTQEVVMMGMPDKKYPTEYIYTTGWMLGETGKTYTLTVEYKDFKATAVTTIPAPVPLDRLESAPTEGDRMSVTAHFTDPEGKQYYHLFCQVDGTDKTFLPCFLGVVDDSDLSGETSVIVYKGTTLSRPKFEPDFAKGDLVRVRLCTMDESSWHFWSDFEQLSMLSASPVFPVRFNIKSNMQGAIGYWAGYGVSEKTISLE